MKHTFIKGALLSAALVSTTVTAAELETEAQKLGYIIGMDIGNSLKEQGTPMDIDTLLEAIKATYNNEPLALTPEQAASIREEFIAARRAEAEQQRASMASINAAEGDKFLLENGTKEGVQVTDSGLQYKVVVMGDGAKPAASDKVTVHYRGTLLNGEEFDSSYSRNQPTSFQLDQVIPGWTEGLQMMPVGSKFMFYIPPNLAYGPNGGGPIGPNSTLIFEVELLSID
ncbi:MAG: FKBP-type peptidyl-prolyl cis-trans isomerase [Xanthomonadales bacterium]|jgi:FKBP-type peptidyl-prolyl cis-trans isomerase|nr:FKBP-type peptidyl-prolyl cis-trans isomerase [Xanthomonadales bacterium]MDH3923080.1 FKBP-type peptidyl-prolyl cis-trans isomerase [Xanthomonadales bacterium]MDH3941000.1 FKBP-type peptidyl-prolyl cis-trans isomerase [Xanthomonadales bacterium]MDH3999925.1 FKBP-type peptidyl-prolyl cis-trans isomerase [Xanthomonadales bacterium]